MPALPCVVKIAAMSRCWLLTSCRTLCPAHFLHCTAPVHPRTCAHAPQVEPRAKTLRRQVRKALGMGSKLQQKQGQLIYKGMPG